MTIEYFLSTQDWRREQPHELIEVDEARRRKKTGAAYFIPGTSGVMCEVPPQPKPQTENIKAAFAIIYGRAFDGTKLGFAVMELV